MRYLTVLKFISKNFTEIFYSLIQQYSYKVFCYNLYSGFEVIPEVYRNGLLWDIKKMRPFRLFYFFSWIDDIPQKSSIKIEAGPAML